MRVRSGGACPASGIHSNGTCPKRRVPTVNASSADGCKSDAECGDGDSQPRCIENPSYSSEPHGGGSARELRNLLAEAPRPPAPTTCIYDECHFDADCGKNRGCECGSGDGADRNRCITLDACLADSDCAKGSRCECDHSAPSYCLPSNCDSDAECNGKTCAGGMIGGTSPAPYPGGGSGRFCHTAADRCQRDADCTVKNDYLQRCAYDVVGGLWTCQDVALPPAG